VRVFGDPWTATFSKNGVVIDTLTGSPESDVPVVAERLVTEVRAWGHPPERLAIYPFAEGSVPGKRAPKRVFHPTRTTTLGGSNA
jgi:hypothetical protein